MPEAGTITRLIADWQRGDRAAESALFDAIYSRLHAMAMQCLRGESPGHSLGPTALLHEAYLRFRRSDGIQITNTQHFLFLVGRVMRRILVDRARARLSEKRGANPVRAEFDEQIVSQRSDAEEILQVDRAMEQLSRQSPRQAQLVELRYFAGFSEAESAEALGISTRTVRREWIAARTRLRMAIDGLPGTL